MSERSAESADGVDREPGDGESYGDGGEIRPVPPGVADDPADGKHAYLVSLTAAQLDQLQGDGVAMVDTDHERFVLVGAAHEREAIEHVEAADVAVRHREVIARD